MTEQKQQSSICHSFGEQAGFFWWSGTFGSSKDSAELERDI